MLTIVCPFRQSHHFTWNKGAFVAVTWAWYPVMFRVAFEEDGNEDEDDEQAASHYDTQPNSGVMLFLHHILKYIA